MQKIIHQDKSTTPWMVYSVLLFLFVTRLLTMTLMPLNDKTEARYGEIARMMLESHNWVTLLQTPNEPFWAKPPLSTWSSALSMKVFGVHAFAARLPAMIYALAILGLVGWFVRQRYSKQHCYYVWLILASMPYFFINAGVVMTDPAFVFAITLCMISAWLAVSHASKVWGGLFFIGLGLGLLAKGPLTGVLVLLPLIIWTMIERKYHYVWKNLPWIWGSVLTLLIALPWYGLAELRTPGFLHYFIVGEHFGRFVESGWLGDKYGFAHAFPFGMIWVFLLGATVPWVLLVIYDVLVQSKRRQVVIGARDGWVTYLMCFILVPLIFFTFSRNIIYTYTFTVLPPLALLIVEGIQRQFLPTLTLKRCAWVASSVGTCCVLLSLFLFIRPALVSKSQERVVHVWQSFHPHSKLIYWANEPDFSARFYAHGRVQATRDEHALLEWLQQPHHQYLVVRQDQLNEISEGLRRRWRPAAHIQVQNKVFILYEIRSRLVHKAFV